MTPRHLKTAQGAEFTMLLVGARGIAGACFDEPSTLHDLCFEAPSSMEGDDATRVFSSTYSADWFADEASHRAPPNTVLGVLSCFIDGTVRQSSGAKHRLSVANGPRLRGGHAGAGREAQGRERHTHGRLSTSSSRGPCTFV